MEKRNIQIISEAKDKESFEELREDITIRMFYYVYLNSVISEKGNVDAILKRIANAVHEDLKPLQDLMSNKEDKEKQEEYKKRLKRPVSDYIIEIMENMKNQYNEKDSVDDRYLYALKLYKLIKEVEQLDDIQLEEQKRSLKLHFKKVRMALPEEYKKAIQIFHHEQADNKSNAIKGKVIPIRRKEEEQR